MHRIVLLVALSWIGMAFAAGPVPEAPIHLPPGAVTTPERVPGTLRTSALDHYGAVQLGTHRFFALRHGQPDLLTETSEFVDVWKLDNGAWKLSRVISYGHELDPAAASVH